MGEPTETRIGWHRLFGLALIDLFTGSPFVVELEKDLAVKQQRLDEVILRRLPGEFPGRLPDGLDDLTDHNLLTYKSRHEDLDAWAIDELLGHYVNYRKQTSSSLKDLLPAGAFQLYAVSTRFPAKLAGQVALEDVAPGVHQVQWGIHRIRVLVLSEMPVSEHNAVWLMFSAIQEKVVTGAAQYHWRTGDMSTIMNQLFEHYQLEGIAMPYTMEDFRRDYVREHLDVLPPEERLRGLSPEEIARHLTPEERLLGLSAEERLEGLSDEELSELLDRIQRRRGTRGH